MSQQADFPVREPLLGVGGLIADRWRIWLRNLRQDVNVRTSVLAVVALTSQTASIGVTPFKTDTLSAGQYLVSVFLHVTTPATINSSILATVSFTHAAIACAIPTSALTTNLTTSVLGLTIPIAIDGGSPVSYSTTYVSNIAGMAYSGALVLQQVSA